MKIFKDARDRTWNVTVDVGAVKRVRDLCDVDLMDAIADGGVLLAKIDADPVLLCDVVFVLCQEQAAASKVSDVDFGRAMVGDAIDRATSAFLDELVDFFPARKRTVLAKAVAKANQYADEAADRAEKMLDDPEMDRRMRKVMDQAFALPPGTSSTPAPASSE